jgi:hypothetical protein
VKILDYLCILVILPVAVVFWIVAAMMMVVAFVYDLCFSRR